MDISEAIRRKIWSSEVMQIGLKSGMSLYKMDYVFDLEKSSTSKNKKSDKRRRKIFEELRKRNIMPFRGRSLEFVTLIEDYQNEDQVQVFNGTKNLYTSYLWTILRSKPLTPTELRELVMNILIKYDALKQSSYARFDVVPDDEIYNSQNLLLSENGEYLDCLKEITCLIPDSFDKLALIGALFREALTSGNTIYKIDLEEIYNAQVEKICESSLISENLKEEFRDVCIKRLVPTYFAPEKKFEALLDPHPHDKWTPAHHVLLEHDSMF